MHNTQNYVDIFVQYSMWTYFFKYYIIHSKEGDCMAVPKKQLEYAKKHLAKLDEIKVRVPKGKKEEYRIAAEASGKSLNQFIVDCIEKSIV